MVLAELLKVGQRKNKRKHAKALLIHKISDTRYMKALRFIINKIPDTSNIPYLAEDLFWTLFRKTKMLKYE